jgi:hypothetical protein
MQKFERHSFHSMQYGDEFGDESIQQHLGYQQTGSAVRLVSSSHPSLPNSEAFIWRVIVAFGAIQWRAENMLMPPCSRRGCMEAVAYYLLCSEILRAYWNRDSSLCAQSTGRDTSWKQADGIEGDSDYGGKQLQKDMYTGLPAV